MIRKGFISALGLAIVVALAVAAQNNAVEQKLLSDTEMLNLYGGCKKYLRFTNGTGCRPYQNRCLGLMCWYIKTSCEQTQYKCKEVTCPGAYDHGENISVPCTGTYQYTPCILIIAYPSIMCEQSLFPIPTACSGTKTGCKLWND